MVKRHPCAELLRYACRSRGQGVTFSAMGSVERRNFLKVAVALPFASPLISFAEVASPLRKPVFVAEGADATGTEHHGPRAGTHLDFKVLTKDTQAGFFLIEHRNIPEGGPVRHLHYAQEEWFYLVEGEKLVIEVGDERFTLRPGDSILAPRNVPHVWAYVGEKPGRMLMGFTPAGQMEDFFALSSKQPVDAKIAEAHGMKWLGPPLDVSTL
jgi:mannose-6-phosphate isomerase-like protein (cupin superfamily)